MVVNKLTKPEKASAAELKALQRVVATSQAAGISTLITKCKKSKILTMQLSMMASSGNLEKALTGEFSIGRMIPYSKTYMNMIASSVFAWAASFYCPTFHNDKEACMNKDNDVGKQLFFRITGVDPAMKTWTRNGIEFVASFKPCVEKQIVGTRSSALKIPVISMGLPVRFGP